MFVESLNIQKHLKMCYQCLLSLSSMLIRSLLQLSQTSTATGEAMGNKLGAHGAGENFELLSYFFFSLKKIYLLFMK